MADEVTSMRFSEVGSEPDSVDKTADFESTAAMPNYSDSGWIPDNSGSPHVTAWNHGLGRTPRIIQVYFSATADASRVFPLNWAWASTHSGNPVTIEQTQQQVKLHIWNGAPLHGTWDGNSNTWSLHNNGYWRILAWA